MDETGQDTKGQFFLVAVVVVGTNRDELLSWLETVERKSGKGIASWRKTKYECRLKYLDKVLFGGRLEDSLYYSIYRGTKAYRDCTITSIERALHERARGRKYEVNVIVDGLLKADRRLLAVELRQRGIPARKVRGSRDEASALTRLSDAVAGSVRDAQEGNGDFQGRLSRATATIREA